MRSVNSLRLGMILSIGFLEDYTVIYWRMKKRARDGRGHSFSLIGMEAKGIILGNEEKTFLMVRQKFIISVERKDTMSWPTQQKCLFGRSLSNGNCA